MTIMAPATSTQQLLLLFPVLLLAVVVAGVAADKLNDDPITVIKYKESFTKGAGESVVFGPVPIPGKSGPNFGKGVVYDNAAIIKGVEVGRVHGFYFFSNLKVHDGETDTSTVAFYKGEYKGSNLRTSGDFFDDAKVNTLAVTGGTGAFEFVSGSAKYITYPGYYDVTLTLKGVKKA